MKKGDNFDEWYNEIVERAELCDKRYPIKGMNIWKPYGWKILRNIDALIRKEMEKTGHEEVYFPLLIPEGLFKKEEEHIKGFASQVYWITNAGENELEEKLLLRPTSETALYSIFPLWIRSHKDLPLKIFQIVNVFRYETKMTKAFIRVREIHFFEAHTCHRDFDDAENQIKQDIEIVQRLFKKLCLPYLLSKRPDWDKFAGAFYSIGIDVLLPSKRAMQLGSLHQYKENFSRPFEITYEDERGEHRYCHQTTYGMSERLLGAIIGIHGDDKGIVIPPPIAPIQVVIVPIIFKGKEKMIMDECSKIFEELKSERIRSLLDDRDVTPGSKFYDWELKGVPLRIEVGPRDIEKRMVTLARRDGKKFEVSRNELVRSVKKELESFSNQLLDVAEKELEKNIRTIFDLKKKEGILKIPWCGEEKCGLKMEEMLDMDSIGTPIENEKCGKRCPVCGKTAKKWMRMAKTV